MSSSLPDFVLARFGQGLGGAMMTPVGAPGAGALDAKRELVKAMAWLTMPALVGPLVGPPVGGFITTYFTWHWIFLINVPIGLSASSSRRAASMTIRSRGPERFDLTGFVLAGVGVAGLAFGLSVVGLGLLPPDRRRR